MAVDPAEPDTFTEHLKEAPDPDAPEADAAEQRTELRPQDDDPQTALAGSDAAEGDACEQARVVAWDEDDYR
ncbi:hypothetical protein [Streptomyces vinaceus]|uniref:hypothetical protein n=1 Tax=Streptomyces vinaceus TaxID=1960 RepID=UPI0037F40C1A